jgi:hypothetical protein
MSAQPYAEYKVPRLLWENFESILLAQSRRYIGELARRLDVPEKDLQRRVLPSADSLKIMIMDTSAESLQCRAYVEHNRVTSFCRKPTAYASEFCSFHQQKRMNVFMDISPIDVEKIKAIPTKEPVWLKGNMLINSHGDMMGKLNRRTQTVKWFHIEESDGA